MAWHIGTGKLRVHKYSGTAELAPIQQAQGRQQCAQRNELAGPGHCRPVQQPRQQHAPWIEFPAGASPFLSLVHFLSHPYRLWSRLVARTTPIPRTLFQFLTGRLMPAALQACLRTIRSLNPLFLPRPTPTATNLRSSSSAGGALSWALVDVFSQTGSTNSIVKCKIISKYENPCSPANRILGQGSEQDHSPDRSCPQ